MEKHALAPFNGILTHATAFGLKLYLIATYFGGNLISRKSNEHISQDLILVLWPKNTFKTVVCLRAAVSYFR